MKGGREGSHAGLIYGFAGFLFWGLTPIYWRELGGVSVWEILSHRIFGAAVLSALVLFLVGRWGRLVAQLRSAIALRNLLASGLIIGSNWLCFVWAIEAGRYLEVSIGYFIGPLVTVALGAVLLKEPISRGQAVAVALAAIGIAALLIGLRIVPWVAPYLAVSFSVYGFIRKATPVDAMEGMFAETIICLPIALLALVLSAWPPQHSSTEWSLLAFAGPATVIPLVLYAQSARRIRLSTLGFIQYASPTTQFLLAIFYFHEPVTRAHFIAFACVWAGLIVYLLDSRMQRRAAAA